MTSKKDEVWQKLREVALKDNIITPSEEEIIKSAIQNVEKFENILKRALKDGKITTEKKKSLESARKKIIDEAYDIANLADHIPKEEEMLLRTITLIIRDMKDHLE